MNVVTCRTTEDFVRTAVAIAGAAISEAIVSRGFAKIGLSGGSTPKPVYSMLATDQHIRWNHVSFFLVDERYVPPIHKESNTAMIQSTLLTREAAHCDLIRPRTELILPECIRDYGEQIKKIHAPDLVILGMGDDGHIASLFPPIPPEAFGPDAVIHTTTDRFAIRDRISVTFPTLLRAQKRVFLITGDAKFKLLKKMQSDNEDVSMYPAQYLFDERTTWVVGP